MDTSLIINAVNGSKKVTKAVTNINPAKDNTTLKTFAQMVNGLTTNSYVDATRINKQSVNEQDAAGSTADITLNFDRTHYQGGAFEVQTIDGGVRLVFGRCRRRQ